MGFKFFKFKGSLNQKRKTAREPGEVTCIGYKKNKDHFDSQPTTSAYNNGIVRNRVPEAKSLKPSPGSSVVTDQTKTKPPAETPPFDPNKNGETKDDYVIMRAGNDAVTNEDTRNHERTSALIAMTENDDDEFGYFSEPSEAAGYNEYEDVRVTNHENFEPIFNMVGKDKGINDKGSRQNEGYSSQAESIFFSGEEPEPELRIRNIRINDYDDNASQTSC